MLKDVIDEIDARLTEHRKTMTSPAQLLMKSPSWIEGNDKLYEVFVRQGDLIRHGRVVWGAIVLVCTP